MDNPFKKRRTELITDRRTLLSLVSPTPIEEFFKGSESDLIEKLALVVGTPGCGKTTIAQVVEFESLATLARSSRGTINKDLVDVLGTCGLLKNGQPTLIAHRLSMTTNFRDIWELPYQSSTKTALLRAFVQAKSVLGWFRQLEQAGVAPQDVEIVLGPNAESVAAVTSANDSQAFRQYARDIELAIFKVVTALVPPDEKDMSEQFLNTRYDVFEVIRAIRVCQWPEASAAGLSLRPMMIIDDAHELHPAQFLQLRDWLKNKAMGVSRWLMCRPDVVSADDYREALAKEAVPIEDLPPGSTSGRDYLMKLMQLGPSRERRFSRIARDISSRYLHEVRELARRGLEELRPMLDQPSPALSEGQLKQLKEQVDKLAKESRFSEGLVANLRSRVPATARPDEALAALRILIHRERRRTPQLDLLPDDEMVREEPVTDDRKVASALIEGARIQLMHQFQRPFYFGMDKLVAASNANIEQFIRLSGALVDELVARVIRERSPDLSPNAQHNALVEQARLAIAEWDFPYNAAVRKLIEAIAARCRERTLLPNAPLDDGANAIGIPQSEMDTVLKRDERLARVLHFAFAYKALVFVPQYHCKNKVWCLLELGALPCMAYGLTLRRGGFIEDTLSGLQGMLPEEV
ncbi:hypothetical protein [Thauera propionica]|jgi:hypothetical protein|uniref:hypothetical protein n=1 Tax=Thauera propionica TaxID=2019431 RepID=UPI0023EF9D2E|nr:hypothetical protein [Thauera propionica]MDD3673893.1 hypothetical protein [Thauera propionica]MDX9716880.1 hypothetical protein [Thauera sp.]